MERGNLSRRGFMQRSLAMMAAAGLPAWYAREVFGGIQVQETKSVAKNDKITMGLIGSGDRCKQLLGDARRQKKFQFVAVCDVDRNHREEVAKIVGGDPTKYEDFRELCARKDIDCVIVATPDHWHALCAIQAMKSGKDVYCEKPLSLTVAESKAMVKVCRATDRVFQTGSQQRSDARFRLACELVRNGRIGKVKTVETRIGANPTSAKLELAPVPDGLNWDFWLGQTPKVDYVVDPTSKDRFPPSRCHYQFRWWYEYSGGKMTDWGAHHNDIAQWGLGMDGNGPIAVEGTGNPPPPTDGLHYNCHEHFKATYTYSNGAKLVCMDGGENGIKFEGEDGQWIFVSRSRIGASDPNLIKEPLPADRVKLYESNDHMKNFAECLASRKRPICDVEVGHRSVTVCHIGNIAIRTGRKLQWDPVKEEFGSDVEANNWLSRPMREPWKLDA